MSWSRAARPAVALAALVWLSPAAPAQVFTDNFNTGTDTGWTHYQPLQPFGAPGTWSFPGGNTYRIQAATSGNTSNPGRAASYRADFPYTNFFVAADLVNWNNAVPQSFGLAARLNNISLGMTNGYLFLYDTFGGTTAFDIYRVQNEGVTSIGNGNLTLTTGTTYRMTFEGNTAGNFLGQVFQGTNPVPLLMVTNATPDTMWPSGVSGLLVAEDTSGTISGADATFDNYLSAPVNPVPEPATWALTLLAAMGAWAVRRYRN